MAAEKDKAKAEVDRNHVVAARKAKAQAEKQEKLEGKAQKAAARAKMLQAQQADVAAPGKVSTPSMKEFSAHVPKNRKGIWGEATVLSAAVLMTQHSPQQKSTRGGKWVMINSPLNSQDPPSSSGLMFFSDVAENSGAELAIAMDLLLLRAPAAGQFAPASPRGERCYGSPLHVPPPPMGAERLHLTIGLWTWRGTAPLRLGAILPLLSPSVTLLRLLLARGSPQLPVGLQLFPDSRGRVTGVVILHHKNLPTKYPILIWRRRFGVNNPYPLRPPRPPLTVAGAALMRVRGRCMTKITRNRAHA